MKYLLTAAAATALMACASDYSSSESSMEKESIEKEAAMADVSSLDVVLASQSDDVKARYQYRNPKETLEFFGVAPGMTVVDTLPGNPWYSGILIDYLGSDGKVIGADYSAEMWTQFGNFSPDPAEKATWAADWTAEAEGWRDADNDASVGAVAFGSVPEEMAGTVDVILQIRSLHHFNRFEDEGGYMTEALADMMTLLKPGGVVGVVLHRAPEENSDATGDQGYVKQSAIIATFENAGFELAGSSEVNANPKDQPTEEDFVWRLPPTYATSRDNPELKAQMEAIGETDRMTLKFRKPS